MKQICIFSANYLPNIGGVERYTYHVAKALIPLGYHVTVVTSNVFHLPAHEICEKIEIFRLPCYNVLKGRYPIYKKNTQFSNIRRELSRRAFDCVVVNTRFYLHSLFGVKFAYQHHIPCITIEHGSSHLAIGKPILDRLGQVWEHLLTSRVKHYCKDFYGVSKAACEWSAHFGIQSKGILYNAVDLKQIEELQNNPVCSYRQAFNISSDVTIISYTGRLVREKGSLQLAKAVSELKNENVRLLLAGDGETLSAIKSISHKDPRIIPLGSIDFPHVIALLRESDIFCLPTVYPEGLPTSVLEAAATNNYIITTTTGGAKDLISGPEFGTLIEGNSVETIRQALQEVLDHPQLRATAMKRTYQKLEQQFTWEITASQIDGIVASF